jgi:hypothetical protein
MDLKVGDWIILKEGSDFKNKTKLKPLNVIGEITDVNNHREKTYIVNFGKKNGNLSKKYEIFLQMEYRKATENEIKKEKIKRIFVC